MDYSFDNLNFNEAYLRKKNILDFSERESLTNFLTALEPESDIFRSFFQRDLFYYFYISNCVYGCIFDREKLIFEFGNKKYSDILRNILKEKKKVISEDLSDDGENLQEIHSDILRNQDANLYLSRAVLKDSCAEIYLFENKKLKLNPNSLHILHSLIKRFYLNLPGKIDNRFKDFYGEFEKRLIAQINSFSFENQDGIIANFYIQDLRAYFQAMGEHRSGEILEEIRLIILSYLKKGDLLFRISHRAFLTYSHNCTIETVKHRFDDVYFQIKNLIVDYEIFFYPVTQKILSTEEFWKKIFPTGSP